MKFSMSINSSLRGPTVVRLAIDRHTLGSLVNILKRLYGYTLPSYSGPIGGWQA